MITALTGAAAKDLGKSLRFIRHAKALTLRDVAKASGVSTPYVQNVERGERTNVKEEYFMRLARGYGVPEGLVADFLLKARVMSALDGRGLDPDAQAFVWRGVEQRLAERGVDVQTDLAKVVMELL